MQWEQTFLRVVGFAIAIFLILFGNRWLGVGFLVLLIVSMVIGAYVRRNARGPVFGMHPQLFGGLIFLAAGVWMVILTVLLYERDRGEPAAWFRPTLCGLGAVLGLTLGTASIRYWRAHR